MFRNRRQLSAGAGGRHVKPVHRPLDPDAVEAAEEDGSGAVGKLSHDHLLTDPDQEVDFVMRTECDALAIACGTSHGACKFSRKPDGDIRSMATIAAILAKLSDTHLMMHGSSSVPQELQNIINAHRGDMAQT